MSNMQIQRDHTGKLHLIVGNQFAVGSHVVNIAPQAELGLCATVLVPLKEVTFAEVTNVIPMVRPDRG